MRADQAQATEYGINGVPFFVIDGKYGVSGAQAPETFAGVLTQVAGERGGVVKLTLLGDPSAAACEGDVCALPAAEDPQEEQEDVQDVEEDRRGERDRLVEPARRRRLKSMTV